MEQSRPVAVRPRTQEVPERCRSLHNRPHRTPTSRPPTYLIRPSSPGWRGWRGWRRWRGLPLMMPRTASARDNRFAGTYRGEVPRRATRHC